MTTNVGAVDRTIRVVVGLILLMATFIGTIGWWGLIGVVPLLTGLVGFCPAYKLFGISTCPMERK